MPIKVLITGGRHFKDRILVYSVLDALNHFLTISCLVHGDASGVDTFADDWGKTHSIHVERNPVSAYDWKIQGRAAGPIRNQRMLQKNLDTNMVIAFPDGRGTANMVKIAERHAVPVMNIPESLSQDQVLPFVEQQLALVNQQIHQHDSETQNDLIF